MSLETFAPTPRSVRIDGRTIDVLPIKVGRVPAFARAIQPVWHLLLAEQYWQVATEHYEAARLAISIGTGIPEADLDEIYPDDFLSLAGAVFEANLDFFVSRGLPAVRALLETRMRVYQRLAGPTPSPTSPSADTASPTAST